MTKKLLQEVVLTDINEIGGDFQSHMGTLMQFIARQDHLDFDSIQRIAKGPDSGIKITCHKRSKCVTCFQDKGTRNVQPKQDSGQHSPIDKLEGLSAVILRAPSRQETNMDINTWLRF